MPPPDGIDGRDGNGTQPHAFEHMVLGRLSGRQSDPRHIGRPGFHGGRVEIERPRLRGFDGKEQPVPSWEAAVAEDWLGKWAMNQMLINVATRKFARSVRLPEGDVPAACGGWSVEIGRLPPLRGAVGGAHEGVDGVRSFRPRFVGDPD